MIDTKKFSTNAVFTVFQFAANLLLYYLFYKYLLRKLGVDQMGVWSLVLVVSSTASITNLGIGSSVVRFSAMFHHAGDHAAVNRLLYIALVLIGSLFFAAGVAIYFVSPFWLQLIVGKQYLPLAQSIIIYSLLSLWLNAISNSVFLSCLDGLQKSYLRSSMNIVSGVVLFLSSLVLVPSYGLKGAALAQDCQAVVLLVFSIVILKLAYRPLNFSEFVWDRGISRQILRLGAREQVISISLLSLDPVTRSFLAKWGGLEFSAYYELANRLINQLKGLLVGLNQLMLPIYSKHSGDRDLSRELYRKHFVINYLVSMATVSGLIAFSFVISYFVYGLINSVFIFCTAVLSTGYFINMLSIPPYFSNISRGALRYNVISTVIICVLNVVFCSLFGRLWLGHGVVVGWALALGIGSMTIVYSYQKENKLSLRFFYEEGSTIVYSLLILSFLGSCGYFICGRPVAITSTLVGVSLGSAVFIVLPFFLHPNVKSIMVLLKARFTQASA